MPYYGFFRFLCLLFFVNIFLAFGAATQAYACCVFGCAQTDCDQATEFIGEKHDEIRERIETEFEDDLEVFEDWMIDHFLPGGDDNAGVVEGIADMLNQMGGVAMQYTAIIGSFLDAQAQIDTMRLMRKMQYDAHRSYRPSTGFCAFGTNVKSLAGSGTIGDFNAFALSQISMKRQVGTLGLAGAVSKEEDFLSRWQQFKKYYCDPYDNNRLSGTTGLEGVCFEPSGLLSRDLNRINRDIDYTRLIEEPRTLVLDFEDQTLDMTSQPEASAITAAIEEPGEEEDIIALSKNLYGHEVLARNLSQKQITQEDAQKLYLALRGVAARRSVAQASFNAIVGLKSAGVSHEQTDPYVHPSNILGLNLSLSNISLLTKQVRFFMTSEMTDILPPSGGLIGIDLGINILDLLGYSPSYFSQLEFLSKRLYQNPNFYAQLYDTPANVVRKKVAMQAIELMVDREMYESQLRREMIISVLLSSKLRASYRSANKGLAVVDED